MAVSTADTISNPLSITLPVFLRRCCHKCCSVKLWTDENKTQVLEVAKSHQHEPMSDIVKERTLLSVASKTKAVENIDEPPRKVLCRGNEKRQRLHIRVRYGFSECHETYSKRRVKAPKSTLMGDQGMC